MTGKAETVKSLASKNMPLLSSRNCSGIGGWLPRRTTPYEQVMHSVQRGAASEDLKLLDRLPAKKRAEQAAQAEDVVEVTVRQQHARQVAETDARLQDLALRAFAAVDQKTILVVLHDLRRKAAPRGGRGCRSAKKQDFEQ